MRPVSITFPAASTTAVAAAQTLGAAGSMTLTGYYEYMPTNVWAKASTVSATNIQRVVTLTSTGNISGVDFTITGTDVTGAVVTETRAGPNNNTVATTAEFAVVKSIAANGAVGTATSAGWGSTGKTAWVPIDYMISTANVGLAVIITATASVTVRYTPDDPFQAGGPVNVFNHPTMTTITASQSDDGAAFPVRAWQALMNSSSGSGAFTFYVLEAGGIS